MFDNIWVLIGLGVLVAVLLFFATPLLFLRRIVPSNEVHIVQTGKKTVSYGVGQTAGNVYYKWPFWVPKLGMTMVVLPVSVFDLDLVAYDAYDKERVPFVVDIKAFFRIENSDLAAQRVADFDELQTQLKAIVQGAVRTVLAAYDIDTIMLERSKFGEHFTTEVTDQLKQWGVMPVKNIELMDIRDAQGSKVIHNIMSKRTSMIEKESREVVAENMQKAKVAEINAQRTVEMQEQDALQQVGERTAQKNRAIGIADEKAEQEVKAEQVVTAGRIMEVRQVEEVRAAEIARNVQVVVADQRKQTSVIDASAQKETAVIKAEGEKEQTVLIAEGKLEAKRREATGIEVEGVAKGAAETAILMAPVSTQITLAKEIGGNEGYQKYLITVKQVEAARDVGIEQAGALTNAEVKIFANSGNPSEGITNVMDLFGSKGGLALGAMLEGFKSTEAGEQVVATAQGQKLTTKQH